MENPGLPPACFNCGSSPALACARCKVDFYCSKTCQRSDWPRHRLFCGSAGEPNTVLNNSTLTSLPTPDVEEVVLLPDELLLQVFRHLSLKELLQCRAVCRRWCRLALDPSLWRDKFINSFVIKRGVTAVALRHAPCLDGLLLKDFGSDVRVWSALITTSCAIANLRFTFITKDAVLLALVISRQAALGRLKHISLDCEIMPLWLPPDKEEPSERSLAPLLLQICHTPGLKSVDIRNVPGFNTSSSLSDLAAAVPVPASLECLKWDGFRGNPYLTLLLEWHADTLQEVSIEADGPHLAHLLSAMPHLRKLDCRLLADMPVLLKCPSLETLEVDFDGRFETQRARLRGLGVLLRFAAARLRSVKLVYDRIPYDEALDLVSCLGGTQRDSTVALRSLTLSHYEHDAYPTALLRRLTAVMPKMAHLTRLDYGGLPSPAFLKALDALPSLVQLVVGSPWPCQHQWAHSDQVQQLLRRRPRLHVVVSELSGYHDDCCFCQSHSCHEFGGDSWCIIFSHPEGAPCDVAHDPSIHEFADGVEEIHFDLQ